VEEADEEDARADGGEGQFGVLSDVRPPQEQCAEDEAGPSSDEVGDGPTAQCARVVPSGDTSKEMGETVAADDAAEEAKNDRVPHCLGSLSLTGLVVDHGKQHRIDEGSEELVIERFAGDEQAGEQGS